MVDFARHFKLWQGERFQDIAQSRRQPMGTILIPSGRVMAIFPPVMIISRSGPGFKACQRSFYYFYILFCFSILDFFIGEIWGILMEIFDVFHWRHLRYFDGDF